MGPTLNRITEEDPTLQVRIEQGTNETILSGMGEVHIDLAIRRMETKFGVGLTDRRAEGAVPRVDHHGARPTTTATRSRPAARASSAKCTWRSSRCERGSGLRVRHDPRLRRRDPEQLLPVDREGHPLAARGRSAGRLPGGRRALRGLRRQDASGRLEGHRVPDRRPRGLQEDLPGRGPGAARADHGRAHHRARRVHGRHHGRSEHPPRPRAGHGADQGQGRSSPPRCRSPRCSATRSSCARSPRAAASTP